MADKQSKLQVQYAAHLWFNTCMDGSSTTVIVFTLLPT